MRSIAWFISHPIQYFSPLFRELSKNADLRVYYYSDASVKGHLDKGFGVPVQWDMDLLSGYPHEFLKNYRSKGTLNNRLGDVFNPGVISAIRQNKNAVVIVNGWSYSSDLLVILFARLAGREVWLRAENPLNQEQKKTGIKVWLKKIFLRDILFKIFIQKFLFIGTENRKLFEYYGIPASRLISTPYAVDNNYFSSKSAALVGRGDEMKKRIGLPLDRKMILFAGKYIPKKNPLDLLKAFKLLEDKNYALVMVGEGELRGSMEKFIKENKLERVYLTGFINQSEIPDYYSIADVFVMCSGSGETWGLAVNEAMNFSKPVIVSDTCGCSGDLVLQGKNGFIFPEENIGMLADCIVKVLEDERFCESAGRISKEIIQQHSIGVVVKNMVHELSDN